MFKTHTFGFMAMVALMITAFVFTGCPDPTGPGSNPNPDPGQKTPNVFRLVWQGELDGVPADPVPGWVYFNKTDQKLYVYYDNNWNQFAGTPGPAGPAATVEIREVEGVPYWFINDQNTNVKARGDRGESGAAGTLNSVLTVGENGNWFIDGTDTEIKAQGPAGATGPAGAAGTQLVWKGSYANSSATELADPQNGWLYYDTTAKASFIYLNGSWQKFAQDGANGTGGGGGTPSLVFSLNGDGDLLLSVDGGEPQTIGNVRSSGGTNSCVVTHNWGWTAEMPIRNIVNIRQAEVCADCGASSGKTQYTYTNLKTWLSEQSGGTAVTSPIELALAIDLDNMSENAPGWGDLLATLQAVQKYVALDLSLSTSPAEFNGNIGGTFYNNNTAPYYGVYTDGFQTGKSWVVSLVLPNNATSVSGMYGYRERYMRTDRQNIWGQEEGNFVKYEWHDNMFSNLIAISGAGITTIKQYAFALGSQLKDVYFPNATTIENEAFIHSTAPERLNIPLVTDIKNDVWSCVDPNLTYITIARNCTFGTAGVTDPNSNEKAQRYEAFINYYNGSSVNKGAGTYTYTDGAWTGPR